MSDGRVPRIVHLGLGAFHRSHQAWYTQHAAVAPGERAWGITAFTGRSPAAADALAAQGFEYTLVERSASGDTRETIDAIVAAHDGADVGAWRAAFEAPETAVVTLTVTEAGYHRGADGGVDFDSADVATDLALLRGAAGATACTTAPGRLVDGLRARRASGGGPLAIVCCDNLTANGDVVRGVVVSLATAADPALATWITENVSFVSSMVDRITPAATGADGDAVVAEPFSEWILSGAFPAGRPAWETAGARFVDDLEPFEQRKLWLLNGGHTLLANLGLLLGHETIDEAMADPRCTEPLEQLWDEAAAVLPLPAAEIDEARAALRERFQNPRIRHRLAQIATDTSLKLPVRVVDPLRRRLSAGSAAGAGAGQATAVAAWHLAATRLASPPSDSGVPLPASSTVADALAAIAPDLCAEPDIEAAVSAASTRILDSLSHPTAPTGVTA